MRKLVLVLVLALLAMNCGYLALHYRRDLPLSALAERYADDASQFLEVDGATLHLRDEGRGPAPPLVLLHGTGSSLHTWDGWVRELAGDFRLIRFDLPGFGLTGPNQDHDYRISRYLRTLDALLDRLALEQVDVAGNSLGGHVAWRFALAHPQRVRRLVLIDAAGYRAVEAGGATALDAGRVPLLKTLLRKVTPRSLVARGLYQVYANDAKVSPELIERHYRLLLRAGNRDAMVARLNAPWEDREDEIPRVAQPTLILWGAQDSWIPPSVGERFLADLPAAELEVYPAAGHVPMEELPAETAAAARAFLRRAPGPPPSAGPS